MDNLVISTDRLKVDIARPGTVYRGARFDWTGFVTQVSLDGKHTFCTNESFVEGQGTGGIGLCNGFVPKEPFGFAEARPGEYCVRAGIGLIRKPDEEPYTHDRMYEIVPFPCQTMRDGNLIRFVQEPLDCRGYAFRLKKLFEAVDNHLLIRYELENVGERRVECEEFTHNFLSIDHHDIGPDYAVRMPCMPEMEMLFGDSPALRKDGLSWREIPQKPFLCRITNVEKGAAHFWELVHEPSQVRIRETNAALVERFLVWGTTHVVSPEVYLKIDLPPGQAMNWLRDYEFTGPGA